MTKKSSSVTIRDVAREAGVSVATVSRFINRNAPISPEVAGRIEVVMNRLKYVPHATARQLATRRTNSIGLLLTNMHNDFFGPLLSGIEEVASQNGHALIVATFQPDSRKTNLHPPIGPHNTDGLLVFADSLTDEQIEKLHEQKFPLVLIHRTPANHLNIPFVTVENKDAVYKLVNHLIEVHDRHRILLLRGPEHQEDSYWRESGYKEALAKHGIPFDEALVIPGDFERKVAYKSLMQYMGQNQTYFDAVFAGDDDAAIGALSALKENKKRIPEDVAVVGFDDLHLTSYLNPPLSTVRAPTEEVGRTATLQLFNILQGKPTELRTVLPTEIILRRSCGCPYEPETL